MDYLKEYERLLHEGNRLDYLIEGEKYKERKVSGLSLFFAYGQTNEFRSTVR